ncbi:hypothetical protein [Gluconobacter albidus]|nr:hypothetical protein [Gluconobacter albidus]
MRRRMMVGDGNSPIIGVVNAGRQSQKKRYDQHAKNHVTAHLTL